MLSLAEQGNSAQVIAVVDPSRGRLCDFRTLGFTVPGYEATTGFEATVTKLLICDFWPKP